MESQRKTKLIRLEQMLRSTSHCTTNSKEGDKVIETGSTHEQERSPKYTDKATQTESAIAGPSGLCRDHTPSPVQQKLCPCKVKERLLKIQSQNDNLNDFLKDLKHFGDYYNKYAQSISNDIRSLRVNFTSQQIVTETNSENKMVAIGSGRTKISEKIYSKINWETYTVATRKLLSAAFSQEILATHSLTGKRSPAFPNRRVKVALNPIIVSDIIEEVLKKCPGASRDGIKTAITQKCADEGRAFKSERKNIRLLPY